MAKSVGTAAFRVRPEWREDKRDLRSIRATKAFGAIDSRVPLRSIRCGGLKSIAHARNASAAADELRALSGKGQRKHRKGRNSSVSVLRLVVGIGEIFGGGVAPCLAWRTYSADGVHVIGQDGDPTGVALLGPETPEDLSGSVEKPFQPALDELLVEIELTFPRCVSPRDRVTFCARALGYCLFIEM